MRVHGREINQENACILSYPNDLLDGIFVDVDENTYAFISAHSPGYQALTEQLQEVGVQWFDLSDREDVHYTEQPHSWVVESVGRMVVASAESLLGR